MGAGGFWWTKERKKATAAQGILDAGGRFAEKDKGEMGAFWNCVTSSEVDVGNFQRRSESSSASRAPTSPSRRRSPSTCRPSASPRIERARQVLSAMTTEMPAELKEPFDKYVASLPKMQTGIETYAEKVKGRGATKDVDQSIQEVGGGFSADATAESVAFEKFMVCAIPGLDKKKDIQGVLEYLADVCKKDPVPFMVGVREKCGALVQNVNKDAKAEPSKTFKANVKKFFEEDQRQLQAWEYCAKRSRKGKKVLDLEEFLTAASDYMEARAEVGKTALETAARITGKPLPTAKKAGPGAAPAASSPAPASPSFRVGRSWLAFKAQQPRLETDARAHRSSLSPLRKRSSQALRWDRARRLLPDGRAGPARARRHAVRQRRRNQRRAGRLQPAIAAP